MRILKLLFLLCVLHSYTQNNTHDAFQNNLKKQLDSIVTVSNYPGAVFSYVLPKHDVVSIASGYADVENQVLMTTDHKLLSGSTGKTFVSAIIMKLVETGKLKLDDPMSQWLGDNAWFDSIPNAKKITIRQLLQHSTGLNRYEFKPAFIEEVRKDTDKIWQPKELLHFVFNDEPLFEPGTQFSYSDTNYILLGLVIESITGKSFYEVLASWIIEPLGLTSVVSSAPRIIPNMAVGYVGDNNQFGFENRSIDEGMFNNNTQFEWTGGGLAFKTSDYARWQVLLYEGDVFDMSVFGTEYFNGIASQEIGGHYGLGVQILEFPTIGKSYGHIGFFPGYLTIAFYDPATQVSCVLQLNTSEDSKVPSLFRNFIMLFQNTVAYSKN